MNIKSISILFLIVLSLFLCVSAVSAENSTDVATTDAQDSA